MEIPAWVPDRWGEGLLFGFSGFDGPTETAGGFVATAGATPFDLLLHTPRTRRLSLPVGAGATVRAATGDVLLVESEGRADLAGAGLLLTWSAWHTLVGTAAESADGASACVALGFLDEDPRAATDAQAVATADAEAGDAVVLARRGRRFAVAYGADQAEAEARAQAGLEQDPAAVARGRLSSYAALPDLGEAEANRLLGKCHAVMRVNTLGPEGAFSHHWTTPDRVPHRDAWLWDSVFHSFYMNRVDPRRAFETLRTVLARAWTAEEAEAAGDPRRAGMISHQIRVDGWRSTITQPPLLAWGVLENHRAGGATIAELKPLLPTLAAYLQWNLDHRDTADTGLLQWYIEGNPLCRSGESGLDNSPRFDEATAIDAVDFVTFQVQDMHCLVDLLELAGEAEAATDWRERAIALETRMHACLWSDGAGMYLDRSPEGTLSPVRAVTGFLPLLLTDTPNERVERMLQTLNAPTFATAWPVPSVSAADAAFGTDMWRGPTWINMNYLIVQGLRRHGHADEAARLRRKTIELVGRHYAAHGVTFEYYDSSGRLAPPQCDRKGPPDGRPYMLGKMNAIRDYHWSAALTGCLLLERYGA